jgi:hypothetical protein
VDEGDVADTQLRASSMVHPLGSGCPIVFESAPAQPAFRPLGRGTAHALLRKLPNPHTEAVGDGSDRFMMNILSFWAPLLAH